MQAQYADLLNILATKDRLVSPPRIMLSQDGMEFQFPLDPPMSATWEPAFPTVSSPAAERYMRPQIHTGQIVR